MQAENVVLFLRLGGEQRARRKLAILAVMRNLLVTAWAMLRNGRASRPPRSAPVSPAKFPVQMQLVTVRLLAQASLIPPPSSCELSVNVQLASVGPRPPSLTA
ncbi:MAG: hypothetical protein ACYSUQ_14285 [Planctomycetota bacterium]